MAEKKKTAPLGLLQRSQDSQDVKALHGSDHAVQRSDRTNMRMAVLWRLSGGRQEANEMQPLSQSEKVRLIPY